MVETADAVATKEYSKVDEFQEEEEMISVVAEEDSIAILTTTMHMQEMNTACPAQNMTV